MTEFRYAVELKQAQGYWQIVATNISAEQKMSYKETYVAHGWTEEKDFRFSVYAIFEPGGTQYETPDLHYHGEDIEIIEENPVSNERKLFMNSMYGKDRPFRQSIDDKGNKELYLTTNVIATGGEVPDRDNVCPGCVARTEAERAKNEPRALGEI